MSIPKMPPVPQRERLIDRLMLPTQAWAAWFRELSRRLELEIISAASSELTPSATDLWYAFSGNSVALTAGVWRLSGFIQFGNSGSSPSYNNTSIKWASENGDDSATEPDDLDDATNLSVLNKIGSVSSLQSTTLFGSISNVPALLPTAIVQVSANTTVFAAAFGTMVTPANARINTYITAERLLR